MNILVKNVCFFYLKTTVYLNTNMKSKLHLIISLSFHITYHYWKLCLMQRHFNIQAETVELELINRKKVTDSAMKYSI